MKSFWKKFFGPMRGGMKSVHVVLNIVGGLGIFIPIYLTTQRGIGYWLGALLFLSWYAFVWLVYLIICYIKNSKTEIK